MMCSAQALIRKRRCCQPAEGPTLDLHRLLMKNMVNRRLRTQNVYIQPIGVGARPFALTAIISHLSLAKQRVALAGAWQIF
jgi:hypothetical protein